MACGPLRKYKHCKVRAVTLQVAAHPFQHLPFPQSLRKSPPIFLPVTACVAVCLQSYTSGSLQKYKYRKVRAVTLQVAAPTFQHLPFPQSLRKSPPIFLPVTACVAVCLQSYTSGPLQKYKHCKVRAVTLQVAAQLSSTCLFRNRSANPLPSFCQSQPALPSVCKVIHPGPCRSTSTVKFVQLLYGQLRAIEPGILGILLYYWGIRLPSNSARYTAWLHSGGDTTPFVPVVCRKKKAASAFTPILLKAG